MSSKNFGVRRQRRRFGFLSILSVESKAASRCSCPHSKFVFQQPARVWLNAPRTLLTPEPLFDDPVVYITGTMDEGDAFCLACCEEANDIQVDDTGFVQVQRDARPSGLYLRFQFF